MSTEPTAKPSSAFIASKVLAIAALGWLGYMTYVVWDLHAQGYINALIPTWNAMFAAGMGLVVLQLFRHREWARRWLQGAALMTALMNAMVAIKPGGETYWAGVVILGMCGWSLSAAREDYGSRDDGTPPGKLARMLGMAALLGTILIAVLPTSMTT
jgi:hypothetical protein